MSEEEKRALQGSVLLEVEEARAALALLRARAEQWRKHVEQGYGSLIEDGPRGRAPSPRCERYAGTD